MATDPSGATDTATVTVNLMEVNEPPVFPADAIKTLYIVENDNDPVIFTDKANQPSTSEVGNYSVVDDDGTDVDGEPVWTLEGADKDLFTIVGADLEAVATLTADHETKGSYSVTIVATTTDATDGDADDRGSMSGKLDVTINVLDAEDTGKVSIMVREPQVGVSVTATVTDQDGGILRKTWQWSSAGEASDNDCPTDDAGTWDDIDGATSFIYTPKTADINNCLRATATYVDNIDGVTDDTGNTSEMASKIMERPVQDSNAANTAPAFPDQDHDTAGDQSESAMREIAENTKAGEIIGEAIQAQDANGDLLIHTLHGDDASAFSIDRDNGQLKTKEALDYETKDTYMVTVVATDPSGAMASIAVTIMLTDEDDPAEITLGPVGPVANVAPAFADDAATDFTVDENMDAGAAVGMVEAIDEGDTLTYSDDSVYFDVDDMGNITTTMMLDHEAMASHMVTITATDSDGATDTIMVTIMVTDVDETPMFEREAVEFSVEENVPVGTVVGTETAMLVESYSDDSDYFDVDNMGQITTAMMLMDYESGTTSYMVTVTATGTDGSTDTIVVTVTVSDAHPDCTVADNMGLTNDCEALLDAKGDLGGSLNWDTDTAMAAWEGVTMSDGRVSGIWLRDEGLDGSVSAALGRLDMLTVLNLHSNSLSGEIPDLSGATMLEELYLANNADYVTCLTAALRARSRHGSTA